MNKHTPGPWHLFERNSLCIESASGNVALCNLARNSEADAKLIAAAPDLLAALTSLLSAEKLDDGDPVLDKARFDAAAAIAKATR